MKTIYFTVGQVPTPQEITAASAISGEVVLRNAEYVGPTDAIELCDAVAGAVPQIYIDYFKKPYGYFVDAPEDGKTYGRKDAAWDEVTSGGGGGGPYDWTSSRKVKAFGMEGASFSSDGLVLIRKGNEVNKKPVSSAWNQNKLDQSNGVYLQYLSSAVNQLVGITHQNIIYTRNTGFRIAHYFGIETTGNNASASFFMGLYNNGNWPNDTSNLCFYGNKVGVGFNDAQANWQVVVHGEGNTKYYVDTGVAKPTGTKILFSFEISCEPLSQLVHIKLVNMSTNVVIVDQTVQLVSDNDPNYGDVGTEGEYGKIGYQQGYTPVYFHSLYSSASGAAPISYVFCRSYAETPL